MTIQESVYRMRNYFLTGDTRPVSFRKNQLRKLYRAIRNHEADISTALFTDLGKPPFEAYAAEIGMVLEELRCMIKKTGSWSKKRTVHTSLINFPAKSTISADPYGTVLIMSPWNYPFMLALSPLANALAAGNCAVLKPSRSAPATTAIITSIITELFPPEYVTVMQPGTDTNDELLSCHFDFIFFTGSSSVGKIVMKAAAENLTPVCLELGGKNPCIIDKTADIALAARRIVWGKYMNAGQTCVAPDYILIEDSRSAEFIDAVHSEIEAQYGKNPLTSPDLGKIVNQKHFSRLTSLAPGIPADSQSLKITPAVIPLGQLSDSISTHPLMTEEIFGPLLPVITWTDLNDAITFIQSKNKSLALYLFSADRTIWQRVITSVQFGGGCINDVVVHLAENKLPFGGVGESGMGSYHGKAGFDLFTHYKSILIKSRILDIPVRYAPYGKKLSLLRKILG